MTMNFWEKKYGTKNDEATRAFHRSRRAFVIVKGRLEIDLEGSELSHAEWFEKEGWISKKEHSLMDEGVRGFVDERGVFFFKGFDFRITNDVEERFFPLLKELKERLELDENTRIFGGIKKLDKPGKWPPIKEYGTIEECIAGERK